MKRGSLLYQDPQEIYNNFTDLKKFLQFDHDDLITKCMQHPALLSKSLEKVKNKIKTGSGLLGISEKDFIKTGKKGVQLFYQDPKTLNSNAETAAKLLGIDKLEYVTAAIKHPALIYQDPNTIYNNVKNSAELLGVEFEEFLVVFLKQPSLCSYNPKTLENHGFIIKDILKKLKDGKEKQGIKKLDKSNVLSIKQALCFSDENLLLRYFYSCVVLEHAKKLSYSKLMVRGKKEINDTLDSYLDESNNLEKRLKSFNFNDILSRNPLSQKSLQIYLDIQKPHKR